MIKYVKIKHRGVNAKVREERRLKRRMPSMDVNLRRWLWLKLKGAPRKREGHVPELLDLGRGGRSIYTPAVITG